MNNVEGVRNKKRANLINVGKTPTWVYHPLVRVIDPHLYCLKTRGEKKSRMPFQSCHVTPSANYLKKIIVGLEATALYIYIYIYIIYIYTHTHTHFIYWSIRQSIGFSN